MRRWAPGKATGTAPSATHLWFPGYEAAAPPIAEITEQTYISAGLAIKQQILTNWYNVYANCALKTNFDLIFEGFDER